MLTFLLEPILPSFNQKAPSRQVHNHFLRLDFKTNHARVGK